jgi:hypothetical protein
VIGAVGVEFHEFLAILNLYEQKRFLIYMNRRDRVTDAMIGKYTGGGSVTVRWRRGRGMIHGNSYFGLSLI